jgi:transketolase
MPISAFSSSILEDTSTAKAFGEVLTRSGSRFKNMVVLGANQDKFLYTQAFAKIFPDRYFQFGNGEHTMFAAASGFTVRGKIPVLCGFSMLSMAAWEQIRNSVCFPYLNVKIVASHSGIVNGESGAAYQALEDLALMRTMPNMKVLCPADFVEAKKMFEAMMNDYGPTYLRLNTHSLPQLYDENYDFQIGKASIYKPGTDICIFAMGTTMHTSLEAAALLEREGLSTMVVNVSSLEPIDKNLLVECVKQARYIVTVEDHQIKGGLFSAIAEVLAMKYPCQILPIGMNGFGESGKTYDLYRKYGLDGQGIYDQINEWMKAL